MGIRQLTTQTILLLAIVFFCKKSFTQNVAINNDKTTPDLSAMLDVKSEHKGILIPRVYLKNLWDNTTIVNPATGLLVFNINDTLSGGQGFFYNEGYPDKVSWIKLMTAFSSGWMLEGNGNIDPEKNFLGTTFNSDLILKRNSIEGLRLTTGGGLLVTGSAAYGKTPMEGTGDRMMWIPKKAAFRAGGIDESYPTNWDEDSIGKYSIAAGFNTKATNEFSIAMGGSAMATGYAAVSMGNFTNATNYASIALGSLSNASGYVSTAMGFHTTASGFGATALGKNTIAEGYISTAMGHQTMALAHGSTAMGDQTIARASYSTAAGYKTTANAYANFSIGRYNDPQINANPTYANFTDKVFQIGEGTEDNPKDILFVRRNGNMFVQGCITALNVTCPSDIRLKEEIAPLKNVLLHIRNIQPIHYFFKNKTKYTPTWQIGFNAQEIEREFPELTSKDDKGYLSVNYQQMSAVAIQAIKEQQTIIQKLEERIQQLEKTVLKNK